MKKKTLYIVIAAVVAVLLIFAMVNATVNRNLGKKVEAVRDSFHTGVLNADGTTTMSVTDALYKRLNAADQLQTLAAKYDEIYDEYTAMRNASNDFLSLLKNNGDMAALKEANRVLEEHFQTCAEVLTPLVEGKAATQLENAAVDFAAAQDTLNDAVTAYNNHVAAFTRNTLKKFPNSILKGLVKGGMPEQWPV